MYVFGLIDPPGEEHSPEDDHTEHENDKCYQKQRLSILSVKIE